MTPAGTATGSVTSTTSQITLANAQELRSAMQEHLQACNDATTQYDIFLGKIANCSEPAVTENLPAAHDTVSIMRASVEMMQRHWRQFNDLLPQAPQGNGGQHGGKQPHASTR